MIDLFGLRRARRARPATGDPHPDHPGWPEVTETLRLTDGGRLRLRPMTSSDGDPWRAMRIADERFLRPVEPTLPGGWAEGHTPARWWAHFMELRAAANAGTVVPMAIELDGRFVGQVTLGNIQHGPVSECWIGYWVHSACTGRGVATAACALGTDHAFRRVRLHRVTATFLPANPASGRVLHHNGFHDEGVLRGNLHINGRWQDHNFVAQLAGEHRGTCVERLRAARRIA